MLCEASGIFDTAENNNNHNNKQYYEFCINPFL